MKTEDLSAALLNGDVALMGTAAAIALATNPRLLRPVDDHRGSEPPEGTSNLPE